ncbi:MAG: YscQ/HrcQ family type III secretion apparatus protein [Mesorhizobium sp.]|nr:YscQ/HrcQ family type III secretion apparatus protein [Mesorhizobium sp. M5C.F.Ca.IN.020.29.1.1]RWA97995.1 MAG: YscQ/HrcQ family type III secretion apparatus protein [Mesorhizobium sp.]TGT93035.1 YscQ/HrcQ family type III secretion apparatus protein [Mesorhizobium sp. M5C.F.Ca.ET.164.01.1.1]RWC25234.1 MAG: YscQ/HrcQ family type III secretion apparatus protein [Mesorhizobium sp.]RWD77506.1 MAG: YscQ/HrcQ family type III secretion apparatus protein [Mesorhizobium sp.]
MEGHVIDLPCYSSREAATISRLAARLPAAFSLASINVAAVIPDSTPPRVPADCRRVMVRLHGHDLRIAIDPILLPSMAVTHWPDITALPLDHGLREILFDIVLRNVAIQVERWCGQRPIWSSSEITEVLPYAIGLVRLDGPEKFLGLVEFDAGGLEWITCCCCDALPVVSAILDDLALSLDLRVARLNLTLAELQSIAPGDVILLDASPVARDGAMTVLLCLFGNSRFRASIMDGRLSVLSAVDHMMDNPDSLPPETFDSIDLPVDVDVGHLTMSLKQLRELAVGQVLDLGFDATTNVSLRVNGRVVAAGELVRIADRTGVRVLDMRLPRASS